MKKFPKLTTQAISIGRDSNFFSIMKFYNKKFFRYCLFIGNGLACRGYILYQYYLNKNIDYVLTYAQQFSDNCDFSNFILFKCSHKSNYDSVYAFLTRLDNDNKSSFCTYIRCHLFKKQIEKINSDAS